MNAFYALAVASTLLSLGQQNRTPPLFSPEVHADHTVTFRLRDARAEKVWVTLEGNGSVDMTRDADGTWTGTSKVLEPNIYGYSFTVDGQSRPDPLNPWALKTNLLSMGNLVTVPGTPPEPWELTDIPHGEVHRHLYHSTLIGDNREFYAYTPPGYSSSSRNKYPVLYLLHGFSDAANGWTDVGKANLILDSLIAAKKAKPMVVIMPLGYGVPDFGDPQRRAALGPLRADLWARNLNGFVTSFLNEIMPIAAKNYRIATDQKGQAIAGLSMGGAETLVIGLNNLDKFSAIGSFSSGGLDPKLDQDFAKFDAARARELKELWVSCGTADGLLASNRQVVAWLKAKGAPVEAVETPGGHEWMVWRKNLVEFAQKIF